MNLLGIEARHFAETVESLAETLPSYARFSYSWATLCLILWTGIAEMILKTKTFERPRYALLGQNVLDFKR